MHVVDRIKFKLIALVVSFLYTIGRFQIIKIMVYSMISYNFLIYYLAYLLLTPLAHELETSSIRGVYLDDHHCKIQKIMVLHAIPLVNVTI